MESTLYQHPVAAPQAPAPRAPEPKPLWRRAGGAILAAGLIALKFAAKLKGLLLLLPKLKILTTSGTMLVSIGGVRPHLGLEVRASASCCCCWCTRWAT